MSMRMKGLCRRLCGVRPARVVHGSGQVLFLSPHTTVEEVVRHYPHHFVCQPGLNLYSSNLQMLPMNAELQSGCVYFLFPLPRLFPAAPTVSSQSCRCYQLQPSRGPSFIFYDTPRRVNSTRRWRFKNSKVSPESNLYDGAYSPWRPRLGCISEGEDGEEYNCGSLWRKVHHGRLRFLDDLRTWTNCESETRTKTLTV